MAAKGLVSEFSNVDTCYIEPQHYNFEFMVQNTTNYERYQITSKSGQSIVLSPNLTNKTGPYFGWRWIFLGFTFDIRHISFSVNNSIKKELDLSLYTSLFGIDLFFRRSGSDYKIRKLNLGQNVNTTSMINLDFDGINVGVRGANVYYIFNHRKFSYPAAFSQSTCQKHSAGSMIAGISYTHHTISLDYKTLQNMIDEKLPTTVSLDSGLRFNTVKYMDIGASLGYAYNWVFARNCLFCLSLSPTLAYNRSVGYLDQNDDRYSKDFSFRNFNFDLVSRIGLVWNNTKWYGGMSAIVHSYNYKKTQFTSNSIFGSLNVYLGFNFNLRKTYRK